MNQKPFENRQDELGCKPGFDPRWLLSLATVIGLVWRVRLLGGDLDALLSAYGSDDLFYFTQIAHFWVQNGLPSIDGISPTTGFQPLFAMLLAPFANGFAGEPLLAMRVNLGLVSLLTVATAWSLPGMLRPILGLGRGRWVGVVAGCLWLLHPRILEVTFQGTEAALASLCWVWSLRVWLRLKPNRRDAIGFGLLLGLGCLARIDQLVLAACLIAWPTHAGRRWASRAWSLAGLGLVLLPWLVYGAWLTGSPLQDSGQAKRLQYRHLQAMALAAEDLGEAAQDAFDLIRFKVNQAVQVPKPLWRTRGRNSYLSMFGWIAICACLFYLGFAKRDWFRNPGQVLGKCLPPVIAALAILGAYWLILGSLRSWYYMPVHLLLGMAASWAWVGLVQPWKSTRRAIALCAVLVLWLGGAVFEASRSEPFRWEPIYHQAAVDLQGRVPPGARIGAFNAGIQAATATQGRQVVNLDGVVNHEALQALKQRRLPGYMAKARIAFLIDHRGAIAFYESLGGEGLSGRLRLLASFPVPERPGQELCLWEVVPRE